MIQSHLSNCIGTWCYSNKTAMLSLHHTADKFVKMIYYLNYSAPANDVMKSKEHLTIEKLVNLEIACFISKDKNLPSAFSNFF